MVEETLETKPEPEMVPPQPPRRTRVGTKGAGGPEKGGKVRIRRGRARGLYYVYLTAEPLDPLALPELIGSLKKIRESHASATEWKAEGIGWAYISQRHATMRGAGNALVFAWQAHNR